MRVRLLYFAVLRDITGRQQEDLTLSAGTAAIDVWKLLRARHGELAGWEQPPLTAVNESYASPNVVLREGDELAFIPPVAGG